MGRAGTNQEGWGMRTSISFRQSVELLHGTVPHSPIENNQSRGFVFTRSNDEPRSLEYQPPGTTRTRRSWSFQGRRDQHRRWLWKKWFRRIVLGEIRGEGSGEAVVEWEGRIHLRPRRGHLRPEGRGQRTETSRVLTRCGKQRCGHKGRGDGSFSRRRRSIFVR